MPRQAYTRSAVSSPVVVDSRHTLGGGSTVYYLDQSSITLTVAYYDPPCGVNYHGVGVTPDVVVENSDPTVDLQLEAGYSEMLKLLGAN